MRRREFIEICGPAAFGLAASLGLAGATTGHAAEQPAAKARGAPKQRVKVGQIGTGHAHAGGKMSTFRKLEADYEVVGVVEPDAALRRKWQDHPVYRGLKWMTEEELLNTTGLQAVAVETAVRDLVPTAARCVAAGVHLHLDKPAGELLSAFRAVLDEATRRNLAVQMGYMFRNNPAFQFCFHAVREGWLGDVFELHGVMSKMVDAETRLQIARYPGGTMFELGCHLIDAMVAALGKPDRVTPYVRRTRPEQDDLADNMLAVFEYPKATATIRSAVIEVEGGQRRQFVVCGDEGTVDVRPLEPPRMRVALAEPRDELKRGYQDVEPAAMPGRYDDQLIELAQIVRGERENPYPPSHDLAVQEAILLASGLPLG
ncbi:MAG TPA: Gfo/Idh/MocA family oxidoreductase [Thermoguttaceae bacterium]|nr:Gfo/Idh/MocA family oxidoreductase [Thermoguttaceae bacterium]